MGLTKMIASAVAAAQELLARLFPAEQRERLLAFLLADRLVGSLVATMALFVSVPVLFFVGYVVATFFLHLGTALFSFAFWTSSGLALLLPAVIIASVLAVCVWFWGVLGFISLRWVLALSGDTSAENTKAGEQPVTPSQEKAKSFSVLLGVANENGNGNGNGDEEEITVSQPVPKRVVS